MKISLRGGLTTLATAALLVVGFDYATYAANGDSLILGALNYESSGTTLSNSGSGPALTLKSASGPALAVNNTAKVTRLNADRVDGIEGADTQSPLYTFTIGSPQGTGGHGEVQYTIPAIPDGNYLMTFSATLYPGGSPTAPLDYSCYVFNSGYTALLSQASNQSTASTAFFVGLSGSAPVTVTGGAMPHPGCGAYDNGHVNALDWNWGNTPLQITFVKVNGVTSGNLGTATAPAKGGRQPATN